MATSYNKLWKLLIDKGMRKKDLQIATGISSGVITKMGKDEAVTTAVLAKPSTATSETSWNLSMTRRNVLSQCCSVLSWQLANTLIG